MKNLHYDNLVLFLIFNWKPPWKLRIIALKVESLLLSLGSTNPGVHSKGFDQEEKKNTFAATNQNEKGLNNTQR